MTQSLLKMTRFIPLFDFRYPSSVLSNEERMGLASITGQWLSRCSHACRHAVQPIYDWWRLRSCSLPCKIIRPTTCGRASLTSMRTPPGALADATGITDNLNPGSIGQTDSTADQEARVDRSAYSVPGGFKLNYAKIPIPLTVEWISRLDEAYKPPPSFFMDITGLAATCLILAQPRSDSGSDR